MRLRNADQAARSSDRRNNVVSWISELRDKSNVAVRKKRGRRAPPSAKRSHDKKVDTEIDSDDAVDNDIDDTDGHVGKSHSVVHSEENLDGSDCLQKLGQSDNSAGPSAAEEQDNSTNSKDILQKGGSETTKKVSTSSLRSKQVAYHLDQEGAYKDDSHAQAAVVKKGVDDKKSSHEMKDDVSDAQVNTTSSDDKSSEEVEDVKVCDICGDVGEEEKLAVCSRCNDGAEHTYCMRVMMEDVPESEWLCEDCQTAVESEKVAKLEKSQVKVATSKGQSFEREINKPAIAVKSKRSSDNELEAENAGNKESEKKGNDMVKKRMEDDAVVTSSIRDTISETGGAYMRPDSRKGMLSSCEVSLRYHADKGKQPSQVGTSLAYNAPKNQAPQLRGQLMKSTSFNNSKVPKVKQLLNEVPQKPQSFKDAWFPIIKKEGPINMTTKSATFKKPKPCEPANKAKSSMLSTAEEPRLVNQLVSQNATNDQCSSVLGTPSTTVQMVAPVISQTDTTAQLLDTGNNTADSNNLGTTHLQGGKSCIGNNELKKPLLAGSTMPHNPERSLVGILGSGAQRKVFQNSDPSHRDTKVKDSTGFRQGASSSNRTIRCQRCNEAGHSTQFCAVDKLRVSAVKPSSERNMKDASAKRIRTSETSNSEATEKVASRSGPKDVLPASFSHVRKTPLSARANEQDMRYILSNPGSTGSVDYNKLKFKDDHATLSGTTGIPVDNRYTMPIDRRDESAQAVSSGDAPMASIVPELDWIWQGGFELWRTGRSPELCDGFQAHLSCSASQLVLEVAKKFPSKVQLEEVPRQNSWPTQFQKNGPTYENVGLFFFARDTQSYENHYSKLVENMLKNDLVLRGSVDAVELLIFPSNTLSKNFQRWNMFYFLWGVFRVSRKDCSNLSSDVPTCRLEPNFMEDPRTVDPSTSVFSSSLSFLKDRNSFAEHDSLVKSANFLPNLESNQPVNGTTLAGHLDSTNSKGAMGSSAMATEIKHQKPDVKTLDTFGGNFSERDFDVDMVAVACSVSSTHQEEPGKESTTINLNDAEDLMNIEPVNTGFEEVVRKLSSSELASFHKTYDLKASIIGKVTVERLLEKDDVVKKLSRESKKLKRELNKAQASSIDLEQRFSELADSLKKCQDEKRLGEAALEDSKKDLEKLDKTHEDDLRMIKNLHKDSDKNAKTVDELRVSNAELSTKNFDLAKTLSVKEQKIQDLERALSERSEALGKDVDEIKRNLKLLFEEYKEALKNFDVRPGPFPESGEISDLMDWMQTEFRALPDVISGASDFAAVFSIESILKLLHDFDCVDLVKFHGALSRFPDAGSTASIRPNEDVRAVKMKFAREFWIASGKEFAKKIACDKLEEMIQKEEWAKDVEIQQSSSESENDDDADDGEDGSGSAGNGDSRSSDGQDDEGEESSGRQTSSPKVDIIR